MTLLRFASALLLCAISTTLLAGEAQLQLLYGQLDEAIAHADFFIQRHERHITTLKNKIAQSHDANARYHLYMELYQEYKSFKNDSALICLSQCLKTAEAKGRKADAARCRVLMAMQNSLTGYYTEAQTLLNHVNVHMLAPQGLKDYYRTANHLYGELAFYSDMANMQQAFYRKADLYRDSIYKVYKPHEDTYMEKKICDLINARQYREALGMNDLWLKRKTPGTPGYGFVAYYRQLIYRDMGDTLMMKTWLAKSALCDIQNAVMDQASLWTLASYLSREGETDRPYRYVTFAWHAAQTFGTRVRSWSISPVLSVIDHNYQQQTRRANRILTAAICGVGLLALLLVASLLYVNKQRKRIATARNDLRQANARLEQMNRDLSLANEEKDCTNRRLLEANQQLKCTNLQLNESNRVKEAYIGRFIGICSMYIDKRDNFRKLVNKMLRNKKTDELLKLTMSAEEKDREVDELYYNFDAIFLHLFPHFIDHFNGLLRDDQQIPAPPHGRLTTTLRVFALIRLGIDDSSKIAEFLHNSVNTIYNYRAKMRNAAKGNRADFEQKVKRLGM